MRPTQDEPVSRVQPAQERSAAGAENRRSVAYPRRWVTPLPDCSSGHNVCVRDESGLTATCRSAVRPPHWADATWSAGSMQNASDGFQDGLHRNTMTRREGPPTGSHVRFSSLIQPEGVVCVL